MTIDEFWNLIHATSAPTQEEQLERFRAELQQLSQPELLEFMRHFYVTRQAAYTWDIWMVTWLCMGGLCSDDTFTDFRSWLIASGREFYEFALAQPDALGDALSQIGEPTFESFGYVPGQCWRERMGDDDTPDLGLKLSVDPTGGDWLRPQLKDRTGKKMLNRSVVFREMNAEDIAASQRAFPRTWKYALESGKIRLRDPNDPKDNRPTPEEIARSKVDPSLEQTDFARYITLLAQAAKEEYDRRRKEGSL